MKTCLMFFFIIVLVMVGCDVKVSTKAQSIKEVEKPNYVTFVDMEGMDTITLTSAKSLHIRAISSGTTHHGSYGGRREVFIHIYDGVLWGEETLYFRTWGNVDGININTKIRILKTYGCTSDVQSDVYVIDN